MATVRIESYETLRTRATISTRNSTVEIKKVTRYRAIDVETNQIILRDVASMRQMQRELAWGGHVEYREPAATVPQKGLFDG